ncbi:MAG TPA: hypothetical protein VKZ95_07970 [Sphingobacteriaceae bacterium]|nr:hypothetical protein [Sphingobacteriaceae bacterium]
MTYEIPVLFQKIASDLATIICKQYKVNPSDLVWKKDSIEFPVNGGKKKIKLKIILE